MGSAEETVVTTGVEETVDMAPAEDVLQSMGAVGSGELIPLLQHLQDAYGYLPQEVLLAVCRRTGIPASQMYGVATFYAQFHMEPRGRHLVRCCRGTACHVRGGKKVEIAVKNRLGVEEGQTTADMKFTFETVACLGTCFLAPVMMVDNDYYGRLTPQRVRTILDQYK